VNIFCDNEKEAVFWKFSSHGKSTVLLLSLLLSVR